MWNSWVFGLVFIIPISAIVMDGIKGIYRLRVKELMHQENIERLRHGYPPLDDKSSGKKSKSHEVIDMTENEFQHSQQGN